MTVIGKFSFGQPSMPKIMGVLNVSPESYYKSSIRISEKAISKYAIDTRDKGASIIDVGAMSTAPYNNTLISIDEEIKRMKKAIKVIKKSVDIPISADTPRAEVARQAISAGADLINDITGLKYDKKMALAIRDSGVPVILGAFGGNKQIKKYPNIVEQTRAFLEESISIALECGINKKNIIVDPSIGFFRQEGKNPFFTRIDIPWHIRDLYIISNLEKLSSLDKPLCVSVSRKSFIGHIFNLKPEDRIIPSIVCEAICVRKGADIIRTHNVSESVQALEMVGLLE